MAKSYYDHIIRDTKSLQKLKNYIETNPANWNEDPFQKKLGNGDNNLGNGETLPSQNKTNPKIQIWPKEITAHNLFSKKFVFLKNNNLYL